MRLWILSQQLQVQLSDLMMNPRKCHLARDRVVFLGHVVSRDGLWEDPRNTETVRTWPTLRTASEVRAFVGMCSYHRRFVRDFFQNVAPLNCYLRRKRQHSHIQQETLVQSALWNR